jgi:hypothetical protein
MSEPDGTSPGQAAAPARQRLARAGELTGQARPDAGASGRAAGKAGQGRTANQDPASTGQPARATDLLPSVSLPRPGGAIRGLAEKFSVSAATGTCATTVPLPFSPGRSGIAPPLRLGHDSGSGNGPLGLGWSLGLPAITRRTDKGIPVYRDDDESDVFILAGAEDLVPVLDQGGARKTSTRTVYGTEYRIAFYRPRVEGLFSRIERWTASGTGLSHWRTISRENVTAIYGADQASQVSDPADSARVFSWQISRSWDDKGNLTAYGYAAEDGSGVDRTAAHEANRTAGARAAQRYLKTISYGNIQPYFPDWSAAADPPLPADWMFTVVVDYGDHTAVPPTPEADQPWPLRPDPFSSYRAGFEIRAYRRIQRLLFFNNFPAEPTAGPSCLARSLDFAYSDELAQADSGPSTTRPSPTSSCTSGTRPGMPATRWPPRRPRNSSRCSARSARAGRRAGRRDGLDRGPGSASVRRARVQLPLVGHSRKDTGHPARATARLVPGSGLPGYRG